MDGGSPSDHGFDVDINGWDLALLGKWPVNEQFDLFAKLGVVWWDAEAAGFGDDSGEDLLYGFGIGYHFSDQIAVRGEWERMDIEDADRADFWTASLVWKF
jgi:OOP family OmpA-OmpF porin